MNNFFNFKDNILSLAKTAELRCKDNFNSIDEIAFYNESKTLAAFNTCKVSEADLQGTTGYGYNDRGRDTIDRLYATIFGTEDAIVRPHFVSGTHALTVALFATLRPHDTIVSLTGQPYDTMLSVIGGIGNGSLRDYLINYRELPLIDGKVQLDNLSCVDNAKVAYIQRSCGYSLRNSLTVSEINNLIDLVKIRNPQIVVIVDNCYGEFCENNEPNADLLVGSLIKNPGGSIAHTGGYIAGKKYLVEQCGFRLTAPSMGKEVGCSLGQNSSILQGLFFAPSVTANALKASVFAMSLFDLAGYEVFPHYNTKRTDIIGAIKLNSPQKLIAFCKGIQSCSPIDSFVSPEPWGMPGYNDEVIMAAGAFNMGASIELSADAPLKPPYCVFVQGGVTYNTAKLAIMKALDSITI